MDTAERVTKLHEAHRLTTEVLHDLMRDYSVERLRVFNDMGARLIQASGCFEGLPEWNLADVLEGSTAVANLANQLADGWLP